LIYRAAQGLSRNPHPKSGPFGKLLRTGATFSGCTLMHYRCDDCGFQVEMSPSIGVGLPGCPCGAPPCSWLPKRACLPLGNPESDSTRFRSGSFFRLRIAVCSVRYRLYGVDGWASVVAGYTPLVLLDELRARYGSRLERVAGNRRAGPGRAVMQ
jgi:hypothetical protein